MSDIKLDRHALQEVSVDKIVTHINPHDPVEVMIAEQMEAVHKAIMHCFAEVMAEDSTPFFGDGVRYKHSTQVKTMLINAGAKLTKAQAALLDSLNRHRGKCSEQKITVQYVNIHDSGQAIIGDIDGGIRKNNG